MDFVTYCTLVLKKLIEASDSSPDIRAYGVPQWDLGKVVFGDLARDNAFYDASSRFGATLNAASTLNSLGLIKPRDAAFTGRLAYYTITPKGRMAIRDMTPLWRSICAVNIEDDGSALLRIMNRLGMKECEDHGYFECVEDSQILSDSEWSGGRDHLVGVAAELERAGFVLNHSSIGTFEWCPTYQSLVWQTRCKLTQDSGEIDALVEEGETPTLDLKRQLSLDTASQKAELIKDAIALANTSGGEVRHLLIGFTDDGKYYEPSDSSALAERDRMFDSLNQERLQTIISNHTTPVVRIRYREVAYRLGRVGKIEIIRDVADLPYAVAKSIGDKRDHRVEEGQVFLRDSTVTRLARAEEIDAMNVKAERVRLRRDQLS